MIYVPSPPPIRDFVLVVRKDYGGEVTGANADFPAIPGVTAEAVTGCLLLRPEVREAEIRPDSPVHFSGIAFRDARLVTSADAADFDWVRKPSAENTRLWPGTPAA